MLNEIDNLLAYSAPVPHLNLSRVRVCSLLVDFEDCSDISGARTLQVVTLAEELHINKVLKYALYEGL
jgi:hypothetical protein